MLPRRPLIRRRRLVVSINKTEAHKYAELQLGSGGCYCQALEMITSPTVFMFDLAMQIPLDRREFELDPAFLAALSSADPEGRTHSVVGRGDALLSHLATKVTAVREEGGRRSGYTQSHDMELYRTLVWDFADAITGQWTTVDFDTFPLRFANRSIHCISVPGLPIDLREPIDAQLKSTTAYLGALAIDLGNPVQRRIFIDLLITDAVISRGKVIMELDWDGHRNGIFDGADEFQPGGVEWVPYGEVEARKPVIPKAELSSRGSVTLARYEGKRRFTVQERVAAALAHRYTPTRKDAPFSIEVFEDPANPLEADLPEAKFVRYLLDPAHPKGGSKARFFADVLGMGPSDWRYLAAQFHEGLLRAEIADVGVKHFEGGFGISFNAVLPIRGLSGQVAYVDTNWIMEPGQQPRLSTAVPAGRSDRIGEPGEAPPVVASHLAGDDRWLAIHELACAAGRAAGLSVIPTPMSIVGFGIEMEGSCGIAWVRVPDARRGFARWAIKNGHANRHYQSGAQIFAGSNSQSYDRERAYASAFAAVLRHNGIACEVDANYD
jgi:hypothetical protein